MFPSFISPVRIRSWALALGLMAATASWGQTVLPGLPGYITYPQVVNNSGLIVGNAYTADLSVIRGVRWVDRQITTLDGFTQSRANGVSDAGVIVGAGYTGADSQPVPVIWVNGVPSQLPDLGHGGMALDINATGDIVGWVGTGSFTAPAVWRNSVLTVLGTLRGSGGEADAIDNQGQIVGFSRSEEGDALPTQWLGDQPNALPVSFGENYLGVIGVNKSGAGRTSGFVVQRLTLEDGNAFNVVVAVGWQGGIYRELQRLNDQGNSYAQDVNANGTYVGYATDADGRYVATLWTDEGVSQLPLEPGRSSLGIGANESNQVVGVDYTDPTNPIPLIWDLTSQLQITMPNRVASRGETVLLNATALLKGKPVAGRQVQFEAQGQYIGLAVTNAQGVASLTYKVPSQARDSIRLKLSTDGRSYTARMIEIRRASTAAGVTPSGAKPGTVIPLIASLRSTELNQPLAGREVRFLIDGVSVGSARTDATGVATLRYKVASGSNLDSRQLTARYAGDQANAAVEARATLGVLR